MSCGRSGSPVWLRQADLAAHWLSASPQCSVWAHRCPQTSRQQISRTLPARGQFQGFPEPCHGLSYLAGSQLNVGHGRQAFGQKIRGARLPGVHSLDQRR
jgi:hypothetical protein